MLDRFARLAGISTPIAALLIGLVLVQIATQLYALVDLARRDSVRGGRKWVWALVIAFGNLPGAIAYLAVARTASAPGSENATSGATTADADAIRRALDTLYEPPSRS